LNTLRKKLAGEIRKGSTISTVFFSEISPEESKKIFSDSGLKVQGTNAKSPSMNTVFNLTNGKTIQISRVGPCAPQELKFKLAILKNQSK